MDPSCTIGFLCRSLSEFHALKEQAEKLLAPPLQRGVYPFFSFSPLSLDQMLDSSVNMRLGSLVEDHLILEEGPIPPRGRGRRRRGSKKKPVDSLDGLLFNDDEDFVVVECVRTESASLGGEEGVSTGSDDDGIFAEAEVLTADDVGGIMGRIKEESKEREWTLLGGENEEVVVETRLAERGGHNSVAEEEEMVGGGYRVLEEEKVVGGEYRVSQEEKMVGGGHNRVSEEEMVSGVWVSEEKIGGGYRVSEEEVVGGGYTVSAEEELVGGGYRVSEEGVGEFGAFWKVKEGHWHVLSSSLKLQTANAHVHPQQKVRCSGRVC